MSNFRETFIEASKLVEHNATVERACSTTEADHPRLWRALEHVVSHRYERMTGEKIIAGFDWATIKDWLIAHWPQILSALCSIIMLFLL